MSSSLCTKCGVLTATLLGSGLCPTCHQEVSEQTRVATSARPIETAAADTRTVTPHRFTQAETRADSTDGVTHILPGRGYTIGEQIGSGGMGCVYKAVQVSTEQTVAIKMLRAEVASPQMLNRFVTEAQSLAGLNHPNLVRVYDFVPDPREPHLVMEFVDGESLAHRMRNGHLTPDTAAKFVADAARGVHVAHLRGIIHRDLKPQNLLVTSDGVIKVADFGLAKRTERDDENTAHGQMVGGTPGYMAPEQVDPGLADCDCRADVWGLGATLYATLVGRPPFPTGTKNTVRVLSEPLVPPRSVNKAIPPVLDAIVCKCLEKDPAKRYQSATELADDLDRFRRGDSTIVQPLTWRQRTWNRLKRTPRAVLAAWVVTGVAVALALGFALTPRSDATPQALLPSTPQTDELASLRTLYLKDQPVTLVPRQGLPKWTRWVIGQTDIGVFPNGDGSAYMQPIGIGAVVLFPEPGDHYRVEAELRHIKVVDLNDVSRSRIGLVLAHRRTVDDDGVAIESFVSLEFRDCDPDQLQGKPPAAQTVGVVSRHYVFPKPGSPPDHSTIGLEKRPPAVSFRSPAIVPGRWRKVIAEVSPNQLRVLFNDDPDDPASKPFEVLTVSDQDIERQLLEQRKQFKPGLVPHLPVTWKPNGGVGVWATDSGLAFRGVTVRRIPPPLE